MNEQKPDPFLAELFKTERANMSAGSDASGSTAVTRKDLYDMIRKQIEHEDNLINQRLTWLLFCQAFFFATFATIFSDKNIEFRDAIIIAIGISGIVLSLFGFSGLLIAMRSHRSLMTCWKRSTPKSEQTQNISPGHRVARASVKEEYGMLDLDGYPQIAGFGGWYFNATSIAGGIPMFLILLWSVILFFDVWKFSPLAAVIGAIVITVIELWIMWNFINLGKHY